MRPVIFGERQQIDRQTDICTSWTGNDDRQKYIQTEKQTDYAASNLDGETDRQKDRQRF